ncbi:alpha/beta fold hydrolase [Streptomyces pseudogriseolus]|uniref:alpha/beta fold hydrolase n=1 Tax=Streptomyces pseudogriseolus TaxID=36817 RepID=UPI003FA31A84
MTSPWVGNSFGGWLAAEIALQGSPRVSGGVIRIGIEVDDHPVADVSGLTHAELEARTFHDPRRAPTPSNTGGTAQGPDIPALLGYTGPTMSDPTLAKRLTGIHLPFHVLWGESDRLVTPQYGRAYAAAIPMATFTPLPRTGHMPQVETPEELLGTLLDLAVG